MFFRRRAFLLTLCLLIGIAWLALHWRMDVGPPAAAPARQTSGVDTAATQALSTPNLVLDRWPGASTLETADSISADGQTLERVRLVQTSLPWGRLRVEETWERDPVSGRAASLRSQVAMAADHVIVRLKEGVEMADFTTFLERQELAIAGRRPASRVYLVAIGPRELADFRGTLARLQDPAFPVRLAEPDYLLEAAAVPNDTSFNSQTHLNSSTDVDIDAPEAWDIATGSGTMVVAVVDSGIDSDHPDLINSLWTNPDEIPGNLMDDDGNGYVDDVKGWDYADNDPDPEDDYGHGTSSAGVLGAQANNATGVSGVAWEVTIMPLRFFKENYGLASNGIEAIAYAAQKGARIASNSWSGGTYSSIAKEV